MRTRGSEKPATRSRIWILAILLALLLAPTPSMAKKPPTPFTIVPAVGEPTEIGTGVEEVRVTREGLTAVFSYVTGPVRLRIIEATLGIEGDPFATPPGSEVKFHTFLVYLENTSDNELHMNPSISRVLTDKGEFAYARDYTYLYQGFHRSLSIDQIRAITYDRAFVLGPKGRTKKLLVFDEIPGEKWQEFSVILTLERDGILGFDVPARFRKLYLEAPD